jgi:hypothetical protein
LKQEFLRPCKTTINKLGHNQTIHHKHKIGYFQNWIESGLQPWFANRHIRLLIKGLMISNRLLTDQHDLSSDKLAPECII